MEHAVIAGVALIASILTLFSGFGLGTLLLPAFAVFFPIEAAVGATAVVHLANNLFKLALVGRLADRRVVLRFGVPAVVAAAIGGAALALVAGAPPIAEYSIGGLERRVSPVGLVVGVLVVLFSALEFAPRFRRLEFDSRWLPAGGVLSGFFGGLSGHQGALRSAFLIRAGLSPEQFVGTAAVCSAMVDLARLTVYALGAGLAAGGLGQAIEGGAVPLMATGIVAAFVGSFVGARLVRKVTLAWLQTFVLAVLIVFGLAMAAGVV
ncbi:MAG: TSUP family transporter [Phycisphaerales bacterium]|nr:TSUP family transporter [Phycisphaerales bacterium]